MMLDKDNLILFALLKKRGTSIYDSSDDFPEQGITNKIYVDLSSKKIYVWNGDSYVNITDYYSKQEIDDLLPKIWYIESEECIYIKSKGGTLDTPESTHYKCYKLVTTDEWNELVSTNQVDEDVLYVTIDDNEELY